MRVGAVELTYEVFEDNSWFERLDDVVSEGDRVGLLRLLRRSALSRYHLFC